VDTADMCVVLGITLCGHSRYVWLWVNIMWTQQICVALGITLCGHSRYVWLWV